MVPKIPSCHHMLLMKPSRLKFSSNQFHTRVSQMTTVNIFYLVIYWKQKVHNDFTFLCTLYKSVLRGNLPSRWLQLLQWPLVSLLGVPDQVEESLMPFMNFLVHSYTCCSERHASPYWTFIRRWISMSFTPSLLKTRMTERSSSLVHVASGAAIFTLLLRRRVAFLHRAATCRSLFKPAVSLLSTYRQSSCASNFYRTFKVFSWLSFVCVCVCVCVCMYIYIYIYIYMYELLRFLVAQRLETASFLTGGDGCVCILIRTGSYTSVASSFHVNGNICIWSKWKWGI